MQRAKMNVAWARTVRIVCCICLCYAAVSFWRMRIFGGADQRDVDMYLSWAVLWEEHRPDALTADLMSKYIERVYRPVAGHDNAYVSSSGRHPGLVLIHYKTDDNTGVSVVDRTDAFIVQSSRRRILRVKRSDPKVYDVYVVATPREFWVDWTFEEVVIVCKDSVDSGSRLRQIATVRTPD